jgi:1-acyl-sn-glycerol-3-phosphate acyltransferase
MVGLGGIALDRQHPVRSLNSFRYLDFLLMVGEIIVLFPEGTYFPDTMGNGKFKMIERILMVHERLKGTTKTTSIPFMPIGIRYGKELLRPEITVTIGNALHCPEGMSAQEFTKQIMDVIRALSGLP